MGQILQPSERLEAGKDSLETIVQRWPGDFRSNQPRVKTLGYVLMPLRGEAVAPLRAAY